MQKYLSVFETIIFWLVVFLFVFIPLYPKFPLLNIKGTFVAVRLEDLIILATVFLWGIYLLFSGSLKKFLKDKLTLSLVLFFFVGLVSVFSAIFLTQTVSPHLALLHYFRRIEFMLLLPVVFTVITTKKRLIISLISLLLVVFAVDGYALGQRYLNWPVISTTNSEFSKGLILYLTDDARVNSTFAGHYDLAVFLIMFLVFLAPLWFGIKNIAFKLVSLAAGGLSFYVLMLTAARVSFVAMVVSVIFALVIIRKKVFIGLAILLTIAALVYPSQLRDRFISTITINILKEGQRYTAQSDEQKMRSKLNIPTLKINDKDSGNSGDWTESTTAAGIAADITPGEPTDATELGVYRSFQIRFNIEWPRAIRGFIKNPLLGTGYSSLGIATDNDLLRSLGEVGVLGTLSFLFIIIESCKRIWKNFKQSDKFLHYFAAGSLSMISAFLLNGLFIDVFEASKVASLFWMILGMSLAAERIR